MENLIYVAVFGPLMGFLLSFPYFKNHNPKVSQFFATFSMLCAFLAISSLVLQNGFLPLPQMDLFTCLKIETLRLVWGMQLDALSLTMIFVVNCVSLLVHIYSLGYMSHDENRAKFMAYLSFFTFTMLVLVTAPNMIQLFLGWEGVGLASYLLIGFWAHKVAPPKAAMKAFVANRVGDFGLILAISLCFYLFGSLDNMVILHKAKEIASSSLNVIEFFGGTVPALEMVCFFLILGAMGKSAQFGLHVWLPDAMEGPTPVSALIHAATMVTAGVFLICRFSPLFEASPYARYTLLIVGALTAVFAASVAITQTDIKRIIAYSTCSQLGYMMMACGASAYNAAMFHLVTHAFFKALLFLGAGSVIHAMSDEQDILKMGGIRKLIPVTFAMMMIGSLALAGIPFFAGFFSKDAILESIYLAPFASAGIMYGIGVVVAFLTAFYSWRLLILVFHGDIRANEHVAAHVHESPFVMLMPLFVLSLGAIFSGYVGFQWYMEQNWEFSWGASLVFVPLNHDLITFTIKFMPLVAATLGIGFAYYMYWNGASRSDALVQKSPALHAFSYNKWYVDELYERIIVRPFLALGRIFWVTGDKKTLDRFGPDGVSHATLKTSHHITRLNFANISAYTFWVLVSIVALMGFLIFMNLNLFTAKG